MWTRAIVMQMRGRNSYYARGSKKYTKLMRLNSSSWECSSCCCSTICRDGSETRQWPSSKSDQQLFQMGRLLQTRLANVLSTVHLDGKTLYKPNGFSWNFLLGRGLLKSFQNFDFIEVGRKQQTFYMKTRVHLWMLWIMALGSLLSIIIDNGIRC